MFDYTPKHLQFLRQLDPTGKLAEVIADIAQEINAVKNQTGAQGNIQTQAPTAPQGVTVTAQGGVFQISIADSQPGVNYFVEYSPNQAFSVVRTFPVGANRNPRIFLGNQNLFFRVRTGYPTAPHGTPLSDPTYFGNSAQPTIVAGGGTVVGPPV